MKVTGRSERVTYMLTDKGRYALWADARGVDTLAVPYEFTARVRGGLKDRYYAVDWGTVKVDGNAVAQVFVVYKSINGRRLTMFHNCFGRTPLPHDEEGNGK